MGENRHRRHWPLPFSSSLVFPCFYLYCLCSQVEGSCPRRRHHRWEEEVPHEGDRRHHQEVGYHHHRCRQTRRDLGILLLHLRLRDCLYGMAVCREGPHRYLRFPKALA